MLENTKTPKSKRSPARPGSRTSAKAAIADKSVKKLPPGKDVKASAKQKPKPTVVRDSFTMPANDYSKISELKLTCQKVGVHVKKSELLRAGLHLLGKLSTAQLKKTISQIEHIKTGRPRKN